METGNVGGEGQTTAFFPSDVNAVVRLNVGGRTFLTTVETLVQADYFKSLCERDMTMPTTVVDGCFFLDRDGDVFAEMLYFMRTHQLRSGDDLSMVAALHREAEYFGFTMLNAVITAANGDEDKEEEEEEVAPRSRQDEDSHAESVFPKYINIGNGSKINPHYKLRQLPVISPSSNPESNWHQFLDRLHKEVTSGFERPTHHPSGRLCCGDRYGCRPQFFLFTLVFRDGMKIVYREDSVVTGDVYDILKMAKEKECFVMVEAQCLCVEPEDGESNQ